MAVLIYQAIKEDGKALWESERPLSWLLQKKRVMPRPLFDSQYQNDPSGLKGVRYDIDWLKLFYPTQLPPISSLVGIQAGDPASSEEKTANYFGHCTAGKDLNTGITYILDFAFGKLAATRHIDFLKSQYQAWTNRGLNIQKVLLEGQGPQRGTFDLLAEKTRLDPDGAIPLEVFYPKGSKEDRYDSILVYLGNGSVLFKGEVSYGQDVLDTSPGYEEFRQEWVNFPKGGRDDLLDAMYMVVQDLVGTGVGVEVVTEVEEQPFSPETDYTDVEKVVFDNYFLYGLSPDRIASQLNMNVVEVLSLLKEESQKRRGLQMSPPDTLSRRFDTQLRPNGGRDALSFRRPLG